MRHPSPSIVAVSDRGFCPQESIKTPEKPAKTAQNTPDFADFAGDRTDIAIKWKKEQVVRDMSRFMKIYLVEGF